jgi:fructose-1,6-bisphosphatase/inositol monophosphatase family enzyme
LEIDKISQFIKDVSAQDILPRFRNLKEHEVIIKEPGEFVTEADLAAEISLIRKLSSLYPTSIISGEEELVKSPEKLAELIASPLGFLIDPIDGTNNFIKGNERFAVMVVALQYGVTAASWIYQPYTDKMAVAEKGSGAFVNDEKITLAAPPENVDQIIGAAHINRMPDELRAKVRENLKVFKENIPAFCAGFDYVSVAESKKHFSAYNRTLLWDHLPGTLLCEEAGGYVRGLDGKKYTSKNDGDGLLTAPNEDLWHQIFETMFKGT